MGTKAEFEEAYRAGFELGYNDGFYGRPYTVSLPSNLRTVVIAAVNANAPPPPPDPPVNQGPPPGRPGADQARADGSSKRPPHPDGRRLKIRTKTPFTPK